MAVLYINTASAGKDDTRRRDTEPGLWGRLATGLVETPSQAMLRETRPADTVVGEAVYDRPRYTIKP